MALTYIEKQISQFPESADDLGKCKELYQKNLWHQLTDSLERLILNSQSSIDFIRFEAQFIREFRKYLNSLRYGSLVVQIAQRSYTQAIINEIQGIDFCEQALSAIEAEEEKSKEQQHFADKKIDNTQTKLLVKTQIALFEMKRKVVVAVDADAAAAMNTPFKVAKRKLDEIESAMQQSVRACPPLIYSRYHFVCSQLWKSQQHSDTLPSDISWAAMFYKHAMSYLGYTALSQIENTLQWADDIALTALIAPDFYDFGELSLHPIMQTLKGSEQEWVLDILNAFIEADVNAYNTVASKYAQRIASNDILRTAAPSTILNEKIRLLSLVRLAFDKSSFERIISFAEIERTTQCSADKVEYLVMKAMSLKLLRGIIDETDRTVNVTWVKPSILDLKQIDGLNKKVQLWINKIEQTQKEIAPAIQNLLE
eukprot:CAMPEP_0202712120 /NCGR_PEP_ID=MMETSP1385-20130828/33410_1 /ASSEMBLY_ACC=CAM_ASM_000861 /TAXON_ID=933848 /ORGANISM="Elphidium margaritaceum" /LENGTH=425 /DNA_ID=CAMNT_0049372057 /DNA_START=42 /DNA_END=1319 /DNA_ORIENTATION=+